MISLKEAVAEIRKNLAGLEEFLTDDEIRALLNILHFCELNLQQAGHDIDVETNEIIEET